MYVDRFTAWLEIAKTPRSDAASVISLLRRWFTTFGVPAELASDGGPPYDAWAYIQFLKDWGVIRRLSSAYFPRSNGRAELGVKSGKRLLMANIDATGSLDKDAVSRALMTYRNTPIQDSSISPAELLYGRKLRDHLPQLPMEYGVLPRWKEIRDARETVLATRIAERVEKSQPVRPPLQPLGAGQHVLIQNGDGRAPTRWNRSGLIVEVLPFRQYRVKYDGSGRLQVRNRQHLKPFVPPANSIAHHPPTPSLVIPDQIPAPYRTSTPIRSDLVIPRQLDRNRPWSADTETIMASPQPQQPSTTTVDIETMVAPSPQTPITSQPDNARKHDADFTSPSTLEAPESDSETIPYDMSKELPPEIVENIRKSTRIRHPVLRLSPKLRGKSHK